MLRHRGLRRAGLRGGPSVPQGSARPWERPVDAARHGARASAGGRRPGASVFGRPCQPAGGRSSARPQAASRAVCLRCPASASAPSRLSRVPGLSPPRLGVCMQGRRRAPCRAALRALCGGRAPPRVTSVHTPRSPRYQLLLVRMRRRRIPGCLSAAGGGVDGAATASAQLAHHTPDHATGNPSPARTSAPVPALPSPRRPSRQQYLAARAITSSSLTIPTAPVFISTHEPGRNLGHVLLLLGSRVLDDRVVEDHRNVPLLGQRHPIAREQAITARDTSTSAPCSAFSFLRMFLISAELSEETSVAVRTYPVPSVSK